MSQKRIVAIKKKKKTKKTRRTALIGLEAKLDRIYGSRSIEIGVSEWKLNKITILSLLFFSGFFVIPTLIGCTRSINQNLLTTWRPERVRHDKVAAYASRDVEGVCYGSCTLRLQNNICNVRNHDPAKCRSALWACFSHLISTSRTSVTDSVIVVYN